MLVAVDGQQQIGDQASQNLNHQAVGTACNQVVDFQVSFPPSEEIFNVPAQLVSLGDLFASQIMAVGSYPVFGAVDLIADQSQRGLALIDTRCAQQHSGVEEDDAAVGRSSVMRKDFFVSAFLDPTDK